MLALSKGPQLTVVSGTITPTHDVHHVTADTSGGVVWITTIVPPSPDFCGLIILINDAPDAPGHGHGVELRTGGNIASDTQFTRTRTTVLTYDPDIDRWHGSD